VHLKLSRCTIRPWRTGDAQSLASHANNRRVWLNLRDRFPHPYTIEDAQNFLQRATADTDPEKSYCLEVDGGAAGGIGLRPGEDVHRFSAEIGYWLGEAFWGKGIMTEVVVGLVNHCFANLPLNRIFATVYANNPASARVFEKAGFCLEGRLRSSVVKDGRILDSLLYARIK
jgi:RimJ/RimL family protein N-acetyltransferase